MTGGVKIWISRGIDWIGTAIGAELSLRQRPLATARGADSSPQSRSWRAAHIASSLMGFSFKLKLYARR
jgi:hypothetical protein